MAVTCGDPAGIGPEVVAKWVAENPEEAARCVFLGPLLWCADFPGKLEPVGRAHYEARPGSPSETGARIAIEALEEAAKGCAEGRYAGVVTAPISKDNMHRAGFAYPGHTEFFAKKAGVDRFAMMFVGPKLKLTLATIHVPVKEISKRLSSRGILEKIRLTAGILKRGFTVTKPRIAVCALNPHGRLSARDRRSAEIRVDTPAADVGHGLGSSVAVTVSTPSAPIRIASRCRLSPAAASP